MKHEMLLGNNHQQRCGFGCNLGFPILAYYHCRKGPGAARDPVGMCLLYSYYIFRVPCLGVPTEVCFSLVARASRSQVLSGGQAAVVEGCGNLRDLRVV